MNRRQKAAYIWYYYKWYILLAIAGIILVVSVIVTVHRQYMTEYVANIVLVNSETYAVDESDYFDRFLDEYGYEEGSLINTDSTIEVSLNGGDSNSSAAIQILAAMFLSDEIDLFVSDDALFDMECERHAFEDLRDFLPEEVLEEHADRLHYAPDPDTGESKPYGICLADRAVCTREHFYDLEDVPSPVVGVSTTSQSEFRDEQNLLLYLLSE